MSGHNDRWAGIPEPRDPDPAPPEPAAALQACDVCGALLLDPAVHAAWHRDELARVRAGLLRAKHTAARP